MKRSRGRSQLAVLTRRETEVLRYLAAGNGRHEIARQMGLSVNTIRTHIGHILGKLSVRSSLAAAAIARDAGIRPLRTAEQDPPGTSATPAASDNVSLPSQSHRAAC